MTRTSFVFRVDHEKLKQAELRDEHYLLRSNLIGEDPAVLWERYIQLTQIEAAFKTMKSELGSGRSTTNYSIVWRPIFWSRFWPIAWWSP